MRRRPLRSSQGSSESMVGSRRLMQLWSVRSCGVRGAGCARRYAGAPTTAMTHIAVQEALDGKNVVWMERVTDEQYLAGPAR